MVRRDGALVTDRHFTLRARRNGLETVRVAVVAPSTVGGSVKRQRARRRSREAVRTVLKERATAPGTDLLLVVRQPALSAQFQELRAAVSRCLEGALGGAS